jgi:hypothetical protein
MSRFSATGLSVLFKTPIWYAEQRDVANEDLINAYGHEIAVDGGYKSAAITINANIRTIEDWLENGLGRDVTAYSPEGIVVWNGFVNEVQGNLGSLTVKRGPMMNVANRVSVVYTPYIDTTVPEPTTGETTETVIAEDEDSQKRYGIIETIVNGGTLEDDATFCGGGCVPTNEAEELRDAYLNEYRNPETSHTISAAEGGQVSMTLNCLGYGEFLGKYIYNRTYDECVGLFDPATWITAIADDESNFSIWLPDKIKAILTADPNNIFSTDYTYILETSQYLLLTNCVENQNKTAKAIIDELLAQGDAFDNRTMFGIYNGRKAYFSAVPTQVEYFRQILSRDQNITDNSGAIVEPWYVKPGKWMALTDFMAGHSYPSDLRLDPRNVFIESVRYDAPYSLQVQGSKVAKVKQLMAKYGVSGA